MNKLTGLGVVMLAIQDDDMFVAWFSTHFILFLPSA
jgi:hypothetical protein